MDAGVFRSVLVFLSSLRRSFLRELAIMAFRIMVESPVLPDRQALYAGHGEVIIARDWAETARASRSKKVVIISFLMAQI